MDNEGMCEMNGMAGNRYAVNKSLRTRSGWKIDPKGIVPLPTESCYYDDDEFRSL